MSDVRDLIHQFSDLTINWPWPYNADTIAKIKAMLPAETNDHAVVEIVRVARVSLTLRDWKQTAPPRPAPAKEAERLKLAAIELQEAIFGLSSESLMELIRSNKDFLGPLQRLDETLSEFQQLTLKAKTATGRPKSELGILLYYLEGIFISAHGGSKPARGWPAFRDICLGPLKFPSGGSKSREDALADFKRREKLP